MKLKRLLDRVLPMRIPTPSVDDRKAVVRQLIGKCPVCALDLDGHAYATLATVLASDKEASHEVIEAIGEGDWASATRLQQWHPDADVVQYDVVRCSRREELGMVRILYTAEMWAHDLVEQAWSLTLQESRSLLRECAVEWILL